MKFIRCRIVCLCVMLWCGSIRLCAQDTLHLNLREAETLFINKNLSLLAGKYNLSIADAEVIQARLYPNPNLSVTGNLYNPDLNKMGDISNRTGYYAFSTGQLILLAGKRNKQIKLYQTGASMAQDDFYELVRTLLFSLRSNFYKSFFLYKSVDACLLQIEVLEKLDRSYGQAQERGSVTLYDAVRVRSLLYNLKSELVFLQNELDDVQSEVRILLQSKDIIYIPVTENEDFQIPDIRTVSLHSLIDTALNNRPDLRRSANNIAYQSQSFVYEKSLAIPDLNLSASYERRGGFVDNASFLTLAMDMPFFNRNQGKIKAAHLAVEQSRILYEQQRLEVENEVQNAFAKALNTDKMLKETDPAFISHFGQLLQGVTRNFEKGNISLIEFTDFHEAYKQNVLHQNELQNELMQAIENVNFVCGKIVLGN